LVLAALEGRCPVNFKVVVLVVKVTGFVFVGLAKGVVTEHAQDGSADIVALVSAVSLHLSADSGDLH